MMLQTKYCCYMKVRLCPIVGVLAPAQGKRQLIMRVVFACAMLNVRGAMYVVLRGKLLDRRGRSEASAPVAK